ncbi:MAG TPA: TolC family protein [Kofleriaceae bacterium]|nr:TolC family protein [Kofleriaceae bacterium]
MKTRTLLVASLWAVAAPALAQPGAQDADDEPSDGPEAQAVLPIRIDDLIEVAVRLSPDLARARNDRSVAGHTAAGQRRDQAWIFSANVQYSRDATADHVEAPPYSVVADDKLSGTVGLGRNLPTGGSVQFQLGLQHQTSEYNITDTLQQQLSSSQSMTGGGMTAPDEFMDQNVASLSVTLKQPLSRGFGPDVALAQQKKAELGATEATIKAQLAAEQMVRDLVTGYWELAYAAYEVDVRQQSLELAKKQDDLTHDQMRAGTVPASALHAVEYEIATRTQAMLTAQLVVEKQSLDLRRQAGLELGQRAIVMKPSEPFEIGDEEFDVDDVIARSRVANRQLATIEIEKKIADVDANVARDQRKPQVDLSFTGALIGQGEDSGSSLSGLANGDNFQVSVGLNVSFELSGAARRAHMAAETKKHRLDIDRADAERQIEVAVVTAVHQVTAARTRVALSDKAIQMAEENVRAERSNFLVNRSTNFQVMQRQDELIQARLDRGRAIADYHEAVAQLQFLSGLILQQYRVNVRSASPASRG